MAIEKLVRVTPQEMKHGQKYRMGIDSPVQMVTTQVFDHYDEKDDTLYFEHFVLHGTEGVMFHEA